MYWTDNELELLKHNSSAQSNHFTSIQGHFISLQIGICRLHPLADFADLIWNLGVE